MTQLAFYVFCLLLFLALFQTLFAGIFVSLFFRKTKAVVADEQLPRAAILLSLRGADPYLAQGLRCLMQQNYPDYELHIVIDRRDDPAWEVAEQAKTEAGHAAVHLMALRQPLPTCSLKCSALVQMVSGLEESREVVVLADADLVSHAGWLRELVVPLCDPCVGATFGNRWFVPHHGHWGSLVRYLWNVAAVVPMWLCNIPWGGTFAIRTKVLRECGLVEKWARAVVEDAPMRQALADQGLRLQFVPSLMMVNREDCTLPFSLDFVKRQLTWTRLYHSRWWFVVGHAISTTTVMAVSLLLMLAGWTRGETQTALWAAAGLGAYLLAMIVLTVVLESGVRHVVRARGEPMARPTPRVLACLPAAILLTQWVHMTAVALAMLNRYVTWRGATYRIAGPWDVRLVHYRPFEHRAETAGSNMSL